MPKDGFALLISKRRPDFREEGRRNERDDRKQIRMDVAHDALGEHFTPERAEALETLIRMVVRDME